MGRLEEIRISWEMGTIKLENIDWLISELSSCVKNKAIKDVATERRRQIEIGGFNANQDDKHSNGEYVSAAIYYLDTTLYGTYWPWDPSYSKPKDERQNLVRAAALILAEIDRIDRQTAREKKS